MLLQQEKTNQNKYFSLEKAVIVGLINQSQDANQTKEYLDELAFLALTSGANVIERFTQRLKQPLPNTFLGKGKLNEIDNYRGIFLRLVVLTIFQKWLF